MGNKVFDQPIFLHWCICYEILVMIENLRSNESTCSDTGGPVPAVSSQWLSGTKFRVTDSRTIGSVSNVDVISTSRNPERIVSAAIYYVSVHIVVRKVTARRQMILDVSESVVWNWQIRRTSDPCADSCTLGLLRCSCFSSCMTHSPLLFSRRRVGCFMVRRRGRGR